MRMLENTVLRKIFGHSRQEVNGGEEKWHNEELLICTLHGTLLGVIKPMRVKGSGM
jgi:hypothetical protein